MSGKTPNTMTDKARLTDAKRIFEGECCTLSYNDDTEWFDEEDEEFVFTDSNKWFEDALNAGIKERDDMLFGYKEAKQREMYDIVLVLSDAIRVLGYRKNCKKLNIIHKENIGVNTQRNVCCLCVL
jgi:hypothetical protein